jgi:hypothetical protein
MIDLLASRRARAVFAAFALATLVGAVLRKPIRTGDGYEYIYMLQSFFDHGTPDLRLEDRERMAPLLARTGLNDPGWPPSEEYAASSVAGGKVYCFHFWMYPLFALPAKAFLHLVRADELAAFQLTNVLLFLLVLYRALFHGAPSRKRVLFVALAAASPVVWYLPWTHPEAYSWAGAVLALLLVEEKRYALAAASAAFAAMQNPPLLFLAGFVVLVSLRERRIATTALAAGAAALSLLPVAFAWALFRKFNMITDRGFADAHLISTERTLSVLVDLNQGLLPYVPGLIVLGALSCLRVLVRRDLVGLLGVATFYLLVLPSETTVNWNAGCAGLMRYCVWMVPLLAWLVAEYPPAPLDGRRVLAAVVSLHGVILCFGSSREFFVDHTDAARFALAYLPSLYRPEAEIFGERQLNVEDAFRDEPFVPFVRGDGAVTKCMFRPDAVDRIAATLSVDADYLPALRAAHPGRDGWCWADPPFGKVFAWSTLPKTPEEVADRLRFELVEPAVRPAKVSGPSLTVRVKITNPGPLDFWSRDLASYRFVFVGYSLLDEPADLGRIHRVSANLPLTLRPRESVTVAFQVPAPKAAGTHYVGVGPVMRAGWSGSGLWFPIEVGATP